MADLVSFLEYTTPLGPAATWTSPAITLGQYVSLTISCSSDRDTNVDVQFSNDLASGGGNPWITLTKSFFANVNNYESTPVIAKWVRIQVINATAFAQTRLAVHVYGSTTNNSISAKIEKIGNKNPEVNIGNLPKTGFGDLQVSNLDPLAQYVFAGAGSFVSQPINVPLISYYPSLNVVNLALVNTPRYSFPAATGTIRLDSLRASPGSTVHAQIRGAHVRYRAGATMISRFTARWDSTVDVTGISGGSFTYLTAGIGSVLVSHFALGWRFNAGVTGSFRNFATEWGISYSTGVGNLTFIPSGSFNGDRADGSQTLPQLDPTYLNVFEINITYLGAASVVFRCLDPGTLEFVTLHTLRFANIRTTTFADEPSLGFLLEYYCMSGVTFGGSGAFAVESGSFGQFSAGIRSQAFEEPSSTDWTKTLAPATETLILGLQNGDGVLNNAIPAGVDEISLACEGTKPTIFRIYKNAGIAAASWGGINNYTPMEVTLVGSVATGRLIASYVLGKSDNLLIIKHGNEIHMEADEQIAITAESANATDAFVSVSFHLG